MAKLRPSLAHVWLNCPKSATLCERVPHLEDEFTLKGERMHLLAAYKLREALGIPQIPMTFISTEEEVEDTSNYVDFCLKLLGDFFPTQPPKHYLLEEKVSNADFLKEGNGIIDFAAYDDEAVLICDYKSGFNKVEVINNPQLYIYAIALIYHLRKQGHDPKVAHLSIAQPSQDNCIVYSIRTEDLFKWLEDNSTKIDEAYGNLGGYVTGGHCSHCNARAMCKAYLIETLGGNLNGGEETED